MSSQLFRTSVLRLSVCSRCGNAPDHDDISTTLPTCHALLSFPVVRFYADRNVSAAAAPDRDADNLYRLSCFAVVCWSPLKVILGCSAKVFPDEWRERAGPVLDFLSSSVATVVCSVISTPQMVLTDREWSQLSAVQNIWCGFARFSSRLCKQNVWCGFAHRRWVFLGTQRRLVLLEYPSDVDERQSGAGGIFPKRRDKGGTRGQEPFLRSPRPSHPCSQRQTRSERPLFTKLAEITGYGLG